MEKFTLQNDIKLVCVRAESFPDGITDAFKDLEKLGADFGRRDFYGISHPDRSGQIVYWAGAPESFDGEAEELGAESYNVRAGEYAVETIRDFKNNVQKIGDAFQQLLHHPQLDRSGACVEWYKSGDEMACMVRLENAEQLLKTLQH
jgi:predicted nucleotide-binding protein (sugar kinase/HSP70/actin superfamily)